MFFRIVSAAPYCQQLDNNVDVQALYEKLLKEEVYDSVHAQATMLTIQFHCVQKDGKHSVDSFGRLQGLLKGG